MISAINNCVIKYGGVLQPVLQRISFIKSYFDNPVYDPFGTPYFKRWMAFCIYRLL